MDDSDLTPDPQIAAALRGLEDPELRTGADWSRLEGRVRWAAQGPLRRYRRGDAWWTEAARWTRTLVPLAVAASLAALLVIARADGSTDVRLAALAPDSPGFYGALADSDSERELVDATIETLQPDLAVADLASTGADAR